MNGFDHAVFIEAPAPAARYIPSAIRAQRSPFLPNPQGPDSGVPIKLVNSSRGNLTFQWRDLTLPGHIPFVVGRVYDSDLAHPSRSACPVCTRDFGPGWRLLPSDHIVVAPEGDRLVLHRSTGRLHTFVLDSSGSFVSKRDSSDIPRDRIVSGAEGTLEMRLLGGEVQTYRAGEKAGVFLLAERRDPNGHWLRLEWDSDRLIRVENDGGAYAEVVREAANQAEREAAQQDSREAARRMSREASADSPAEPGGTEATRGRVTALRDSAGRTVAFHYSPDSRLIHSIAPGGVVTRWTSDDGGRLAGATDAAGRSLVSAVYGAEGRVSHLAMGGGRLTFEHDAATNVTNVRNATGARWQMSHDLDGRLIGLIDPMGFQNALSFDAADVRVEERKIQGGLTRYQSSRHLLTGVTFPDGTTAACERDAEGRLLGVTDQGGGGFEGVRRSYDSRGNLLTVTDAEGNTSSAVYDDAGNLIELVDSLGRRTELFWDGFGRIVEIVEPDNDRWSIEYSPHGPVSRIARPDGKVLVVHYDAAGRPTLVVTPDGATEEATYDETGLLTSYRDRSGRRLAVEYDEAGRLAFVEDLGRGSITYSYDENGALARLLGSDGTSARFRYDPRGLLVLVSNAEGDEMRFRYDSQACLVAEQFFHRGHSTRYSYDDAGRRRSHRVPDGTEKRPSPDGAGGIIEPAAISLGSVVIRELLGRLFDSHEASLGGSHCLTTAAVGDLAGGSSGVGAFIGCQQASTGFPLWHLLPGVRAQWSRSMAVPPLLIPPIGQAGRGLQHPGGEPSIEFGPIADDDDPPLAEECLDEWGFCDASCSSEQCFGGGFGGGGGGGGGGEGSCTLSVSPTYVEIAPNVDVQFTATASGCGGSPAWSAPQGIPSNHIGSTYTVQFPATGQFIVSVTADGISRQATVLVAPASCNFTPAASSNFPVVGDRVTFGATGNCAQYSWNVGSAGCPTSGTTNPWATRFLQTGIKHVVASGSISGFDLTEYEFDVTVRSCTTSVSGPSAACEGQSVCYSATVTGEATGTYTWTAAGALLPSQTGPDPSFCTVFPEAGTFSVGVGFDKDVGGCSPVTCQGSSQQVDILPTSASTARINSSSGPHALTTVTACTPPPPTVQVNSPDPLKLLTGDTSTVSATGRDGFGNPASGTYSWSVSSAAVATIAPSGSQVQVTGTGAGAAILSVTFTTSAGVATDSISLNVEDLVVQLSATPAAYLPTDQSDVEFTITLQPSWAMKRIRATLSGVTSFPGHMMNVGTSTDPDFLLDPAQNPGTTVDPNLQIAETTSPVNSITITVSSADYGGRAYLSAETIDPPLRQSQARLIPLDTDGDTLPDAWESTSGYFSSTSADTDGDGIPDAEDDDDSSPAVIANAGPSTPPGAQTSLGLTGDGLTAYEEYRGFAVSQVPTRTSPSVKDIFIHSALTAYGVGYAGALTGFQIHEIRDSEWDNFTSRLINYNRGPIPGSDQAAIRVVLDPNQDPSGVTGQTYKTTTGFQNETPNETSRSEINLAAIQNQVQPVFLAGPDGVYGTPDDALVSAWEVYTAVEFDQAIRETIAHEVGHNLHVEHEFFYHDVIVVSFGKGSLQGDFFEGAVVVGAGPDGVCQTSAATGDVQVTAPGQAGVSCVKTGTDGIANTTADPGDQQLIMFNHGVSNAPCICQGQDGVLNTAPSGDDSGPVNVGGLCSTAILSGSNGICESFPPTGTRRTIMTSELFLPVPSAYDSVDLGQVRAHIKHP